MTGRREDQGTVEFTTCCLHSCGQEEPLSGGHFGVGTEHSGVVFWPTEDAARAAAIEYARKLVSAGIRHRFIVRRTETRVVWTGDLP